MANRPKVGIIIPAYKVEKYIFRALESCIMQTYPNIEIVVVDDGSPDDTYNIVKAYADKDNRIKLYRQENKGVSCARNRALGMCTADYVLFLDSDDWLETDAVEKLVARTETMQDSILISSGCYYAYFNNENVIYKLKAENEKNSVSMASEEVIMYVGQQKYCLRSSCYKLYSMSVINQNNIRFDCEIRHGEDGLFVFDYLKHVDKFYYFPDPLWNILERPGSSTRSPYNSTMISAITAVEKMLLYQDNSKALVCELKKHFVHRAIYVLGEALVAHPTPKKDVKMIRKKLRKQFWLYISLQNKLKPRIIYVFETFAPEILVKYLLRKRNEKRRK